MRSNSRREIGSTIRIGTLTRFITNLWSDGRRLHKREVPHRFNVECLEPRFFSHHRLKRHINSFSTGHSTYKLNESDTRGIEPCQRKRSIIINEKPSFEGLSILPRRRGIVSRLHENTPSKSIKIESWHMESQNLQTPGSVFRQQALVQ